MNVGEKFFRVGAKDFEKIPGAPIAYWIGKQIRKAFSCSKLHDVAEPKTGFTTGDNEQFLRLWHEVEADKLGIRWFYLNKGGAFRKWYGNNEYVVDWEANGSRIKQFAGSSIANSEYYFKEGITWSKISSFGFSGRLFPSGYLFDAVGLACFPKKGNFPNLTTLLAIFNARTSIYFLNIINPTLSFSTGPVGNLPVPPMVPVEVQANALKCVEIAKNDWNSYETSWEFQNSPLMQVYRAAILENKVLPLESIYESLRKKWEEDCVKVRFYEEENNRAFVRAYGVEEELKPDVPWKEITLHCNPWSRNGVKCVDCGGDKYPKMAHLEDRLKADTAKELLSYFVGCMMGRYSLDKDGLILANQGETIEDYHAKIGTASPSFEPDGDGIIPVLDDDWFEDDIVTRFWAFVRAAFGEEHYMENMEWIEDALGKPVRDYFTKDFYKDHLRRYRNRPIYWMFQSPKGAFRALVYMHRYRPDTAGGVLGYLRSLQTKVENQIGVQTQTAGDAAKSASEKVRAGRELAKFVKMQKELDDYEKNVLYPLSTERIEIDLDDGVKVNYAKFGRALKAVPAIGRGE